MFSARRSQFNSVVMFAADASLTALSERVHRGSLANARRALDERLDADLGARHAMVEFETRSGGSARPAVRRSLSG